MKHTSTKKLTTLGLLCTLAYIATVFGRVPLVLFLKYDPKDVVIVIGGLLFSPLTALAISVIVSVTEMFTVSSTGFWGCLMNVISSCAFSMGKGAGCPAPWEGCLADGAARWR